MMSSDGIICQSKESRPLSFTIFVPVLKATNPHALPQGHFIKIAGIRMSLSLGHDGR